MQLEQIHAYTEFDVDSPVIPLQSPDDEDAPDVSKASQAEPRIEPVSTESSTASSNVENNVPETRSEVESRSPI